MQARLSARDLACRRGERLLFRKLTLDLAPGDMLHVRGHNGVGKTSLANLLSERLGARLILEGFDENPFLADFYEEPERYAFQTQLFFLLQRYQQQQELRQVDMFHNLLIADYMFVKDRLFASLNLDEKEMTLYDTVANLLEKNVINPDLVIYLQADTNTLMRNIARRGREMEKNISEGLSVALIQPNVSLHEKWYGSNNENINTLLSFFIR